MIPVEKVDDDRFRVIFSPVPSDFSRILMEGGGISAGDMDSRGDWGIGMGREGEADEGGGEGDIE